MICELFLAIAIHGRTITYTPVLTKPDCAQINITTRLPKGWNVRAGKL